MTRASDLVGPLVGSVSVLAIAASMSLLLGESKPVMSYVMTTGAWEFEKNIARNEFAGLKSRDCPLIDESVEGAAIVSGELMREGVGIDYSELMRAAGESRSVYMGSIGWEVNNISRANKVGMTLAHKCRDQTIWSEYWYELPLAANRRELGE